MNGWLFGIGSVLIVLMFFGWLLLNLSAKFDRCEEAGGIPVKSQNGPVYCFDRGALVYLDEEAAR